MKNLVIVFALLFSASLFIVSCSKVETPNVTGSGTSGQSTANTSAGKLHNSGSKCASSFGTNWLFDDEEIKCWPSPLDCYDDIVVKPTQGGIVQIFENAVNGGPREIQDFFTNQQWQLLFPGLDGTDNLAKLQSGTYDMIMKADSENNIYYYAAGSKLPLTLQNEEFVLRLDKSQM